MKSKEPGRSISKTTLEVEIINVTNNGVWLLVRDKEYFLSYKDYPWFSDAKVSDIYNVKLEGINRLNWESLDVDLELDCLEHPEAYPLVYYP